MLRAGKFVEHIRAASELYDASVKSGNGDKVTQYLQLLRQIGYGGYMFFDMLTIPDALGVKKFESAKKATGQCVSLMVHWADGQCYCWYIHQL